MKNTTIYVFLFFLTGCAWELPERKGVQTCTIKPSIKIDKTAGNKLSFAVSLTSTDEVVSASYAISGPSNPTSTSPSGTTYSSQVTVTTGGTYNIEAKVTDKCGTTYAVTGSLSTDGCVTPTADLKINANADVKLTTITLENSTDVKILNWKVNGAAVTNTNSNSTILSYPFERGKSYDILASYTDNCAKNGESKVTYTTGSCSPPTTVTVSQSSTSPVELTAKLEGGNSADVRGDGVKWEISPVDGSVKSSDNSAVVFTGLKAGTAYTITAKFSTICGVAQAPNGSTTTSAPAVLDKTVWSIIGSSNDDGVADMEVDASGNVYIVGVIASAQMNFGNGKTLIKKNGGNDIFVAKFDSKGDCVWVNSGGSAGNDEVNSLVVNSSGEVFLVGSIRGASSFEGTVSTPLYGVKDIVVAKCNANGNWGWAIVRGGSQEDTGKDIQFVQTTQGVAKLGVIGELRGSGTFGFPGRAFTTIKDVDIFLTYVDFDGSNNAPVIWISDGVQETSAFAVSSDQKTVFLAGKFIQTFNFTDPNYAGKALSGVANQWDAFIYNWNPVNTGTEWTAQAKGLRRAEGISICRGPDNALYTAGILDGTMNGGANNSSVGCFWAKYDISKGSANDKTGAIQWSKSSGASSESYGKITYGDALVYAGQFQNTANLGISGSQIRSNGGTDYFMVVIDPGNGNITKQFYGGGSGNDGISKAISRNGFIYATGSFTGSQNINGVNLTNTSGVRNIFIAKIK